MSPYRSSSGHVAAALANRRSAPLRIHRRPIASGIIPTVALLSFILVAVSDASAQITEIRVDQIDNSSGGPPLDGYVTNDVFISFSGRYTGSQLLVLLDQGSIYQDPDGDIRMPDFTSASVEFDTFVAQGLPLAGSINYEQLNGNILGAINLGGPHPGTFDTDLLNIAWHPSGGDNLEDFSNFLTARITLSDDASGSWAYLASAQQEITIEDRIIQGGVIQNGTIVLPVPEPGTCSIAALATLAGLVYVRRRVGSDP